ncbi:MAG: Lrp/AsnC family transcriptional regulator [Anaerolineales bacterium]|nr:Lrp/AsnC family transcriptional regulator [Anaerolineales bacterium]
MSFTLDAVDREIIRLLLQDGRQSNAELARQIEGANERLVRYRIGRLLKEGVIQINAIVNPAALGYGLIADVWVEVEAGQAVKVAKKLAELDRARFVSYSTGGMKNVTVQIVARNLEEMYAYVSEVIENVPGVERTQIMLIPSILKDIDDWLPPADAARPGSDGRP